MYVAIPVLLMLKRGCGSRKLRAATGRRLRRALTCHIENVDR
jgi:hypothetical protein